MKSLLISIALFFCLPAFADITIATGGEGGKYERAGVLIAAQLKKKGADAEVINTTGSVENLQLLRDGDAHIVLSQADTLNNSPVPGAKAKGLYTESVMWVYNPSLGFGDLNSIEKNKRVRMVLVDGSGAMSTMQSFVNEDSDWSWHYENAILVDDVYEAADIVAEGKYSGHKIAGMLYVGGTLPAEIKEDFRGMLGIGEATDSDFDDAKDINGDKLYHKCTLNKKHFVGFKFGSMFSLDTVCVQAMAVYSTDGLDPKVGREISKAINKARRAL